MTKTDNWGGARPGAGRKPKKVEKVTVSFRLPTETKEKIQWLRDSGVDVTTELCKLIRRLQP